MTTAGPFPKGAKVRLKQTCILAGEGSGTQRIAAGQVGEYVGADLSDPRFERVSFEGVIWPGVHATDLEAVEGDA